MATKMTRDRERDIIDTALTYLRDHLEHANLALDENFTYEELNTVQLASSNVDLALNEFRDTIEATGGISYNHKGIAAPAVDEEWSDLGAAYLSACHALRRHPMTSRAGCRACGDELESGETVCAYCGTDNSAPEDDSPEEVRLAREDAKKLEVSR